MKFNNPIKIGKRLVGPGHPTYVIAEIGSNFDGSLERAKKLAKLCKDAGADAYKIQNFLAPQIVSEEGFKNLKIGYQSTWKESVVEVYRKAEFPRAWVKELSDYCKKIGIDFFSSPWDTEAVELLEKVGVPAYKIGSGELDNLEFIRYVAKTGKPIIISTGTGTLVDVSAAVHVVKKTGNKNLALLQCTVNYPASVKEANLKAMVSMGKKFSTVVGYSDHSIGKEGGSDDPLGGLLVPLGAVALGGCIVEKHVTDDRTRKGPDHSFAITIPELRHMVQSIRAMEAALGDGIKRPMPSEKETVISMRRGMFATMDIAKGETFARNMIAYLRPAVGLRPPMIGKVIGKKAKRTITAGQPICTKDVF
ncbi:flagellar biosynthesis protein FlgA [Candidatus Kaiserbacteria bacterium]|nr:flagellar biosynthesis protein FlgA [Candidatus Kaiserbacteria bacterium]